MSEHVETLNGCEITRTEVLERDGGKRWRYTVTVGTRRWSRRWLGDARAIAEAYPNVTMWGDPVYLVDEEEYCTSCERALPLHYDGCRAWGDLRNALLAGS